MNKKFFFCLLLLVISYQLSVIPAFAQTGQVDLSSAPDITVSQGTGAAGALNWVQAFYRFSLIAGVFLAVGVIVWAGFRYALAAGNPSTQSDARDQILQALLGLILLFGAYLILYVINPNLINLNLPTLQTVSVPTTVSVGPTTPGGGCYNCSGASVPIKSGIACGSNCQVNSELNNRLSALAGRVGSWEVTEAWPPQGYSPETPKGIHSNSCHGSGTCVDAGLRGTSAGTPQAISNFISAATDSNLRAVYEVRTDERRMELIRAGVNASNIQTVPRINAEHFSVYMPGTPPL